MTTPSVISQSLNVCPAGTSSYTLGRPAGAANGDFVVWIQERRTLLDADFPGGGNLSPNVGIFGGYNNTKVDVGYHPITDITTEPAAYSIDFGAVRQQQVFGALFLVRSSDPTRGPNQAVQNAIVPISNVITNPITTTEDEELLLTLFVANSLPSGQFNNTTTLVISTEDLVIGWRNKLTAGLDTASMTLNATPSQTPFAITIAFPALETAPLAPPITAPTPGSALDMNAGFTLSWLYSDAQAGHDPQSKIHIRRTRVGTGIQSYWNGTDFSSAVQVDVPYALQSITFPAGLFTNEEWLIEVATMDTLGPTFGPYSTPADYIGADSPVVSLYAPIGVITDTTLPVAKWLAVTQSKYKLDLWTAAVYNAVGFNANQVVPFWSSGVVVSTTSRSAIVAQSIDGLPNNTSWVLSVTVYESHGVPSLRSYSAFSIAVQPAAVGDLNVDETPDQGYFDLTFIGKDNQLTAEQASIEPGALAWHVPSGGNANVAIDASQALIGDQSLQITTVADGDVVVEIAGALAVDPTEIESFLVSLKHGGIPRPFMVDVYYLDQTDTLQEEIFSPPITMGSDVTVPPPPPPPPIPTYEIYYSSSPTRSGKIVLNGSTVVGNIYPFVSFLQYATDVSAITKVEWFIDVSVSAVTAQMTAGTPESTDSLQPFDYKGTAVNGNANPFNTLLQPGTVSSPATRVIGAKVTRTDASVQSIISSFNIANPDPIVGTFSDLPGILKDFYGPPKRTLQATWTDWGADDFLVHGVVVGSDWYDGARGFVIASQASPGGQFSWWEVMCPRDNSGGTSNVRAQFRRFQIWKLISASNWSAIGNTDLIEANGQYDRADSLSGPGAGIVGSFGSWGGVRSEPASNGGGTSITLRPLLPGAGIANCDMAHGWPSLGLSPTNNALATYYSFQVRLIPDTDPNVNLASAKFTIAGGGDMYADAQHTVYRGGPLQTRQVRIGYKGQNSFDGWTVHTVSGITAAGLSSIGVTTSPNATQLAEAIKTIITNNPPPLQVYP